MERQWIRQLRQAFPSHPALTLPVGDDAAVVAVDGQCVVTVDMLMDGVDFELDRIDPRRAGHKALAVNLSDLAAMASQPLAAVVAVALPRSGGRALATALYDGLLPLAERYRVALAGGDTNSWDGPLVVSITALGTLTERGPLRRSGAHPGDRIVVTGRFGGSILGRHLDFEPRVREALALHARYELHAGIDVSDGLARDLGHLVEESGVGAVLDLPSIPIHPDAVELAARQADGRTALDHALGDGEDFELILAAAPDVAARMVSAPSLGFPLTDIGEFTSRPGCWKRDASGRLEPLDDVGYEHRFD